MSAHRAHRIVWADVVEGASRERSVWDPASRDALRKATLSCHRQHAMRRRRNETPLLPSASYVRREQMKKRERQCDSATADGRPQETERSDPMQLIVIDFS
jgi:hypothetical protein